MFTPILRSLEEEQLNTCMKIVNPQNHHRTVLQYLLVHFLITFIELRIIHLLHVAQQHNKIKYVVWLDYSVFMGRHQENVLINKEVLINTHTHRRARTHTHTQLYYMKLRTSKVFRTRRN